MPTTPSARRLTVSNVAGNLTAHFTRSDLHVDGVDGVKLRMVVCCPWDLDGDISVGINDFLDLLAQWGTDPGGPPDFDKMLLEARAELDQTRRKEIYTDMALMMRDEGGLILPMFNDFIDGSTTKLEGQITDRAGPSSNDMMINRTWLAA